MMDGYVKNMTHMWAHTMKRSVGPGAKIPLQELYEQYGAKHNLKEGEEFIGWLQEVKLRDRNKWRIFTEDNKPRIDEVSKSQVEILEKGSVDKNNTSRGDGVAPAVPKEMEVDEVVELSVRKAREVIPKIHDIQLLKYAVQQANQRSGKDSLCRILRKRIQELEISNRQ